MISIMSKIFSKLLNYPYRFLIKRKFFKEKNLNKKFSLIYNTNYWDDKESFSGPGSSLENTKNLRKQLPKILKKFKIKKILDAPCGDCNWIKFVVEKTKINYIGIDIVKKCIINNKSKFKNKNFKFKRLDITKDKLPKADLFICRDFMFHLSFKDNQKFLRNIKKLNAKYILLSNHAKGKENKILNIDIKSGDFRKINLFNSPYNFKTNYKFIINDSYDGVKKYLILFEKKEFSNFFDYMKI